MATELPSCRAALTQVLSWSERHHHVSDAGVKWLVKSNTYLFVEVIDSPSGTKESSQDVGG
jgi:hypothetical protein